MSNRESSREFTEEINEYFVLILKTRNYRRSNRKLPEGFTIVPVEQLQQYREQEKFLLQMRFNDWMVPFCRKMQGYRPDTPIFIATGSQLIGGVYLCAKNEFDHNITTGQVHYAFIHPDFAGMGLYSVLFRKAVDRCETWGLSKLYLNSDRHLLPEVYMRWGAELWKTIPKQRRYIDDNSMIYPLLWPIKNLVRELLNKWFEYFVRCD